MLYLLTLLFFFQPINTSDSSVLVSVTGKGWTGYGTGTVIARTYPKVGSDSFIKSLIITNAHVVRDNTNPIYITYLYDGEWYVQECTYIAGSKVIQIRPDLIDIDGPDLAILELNCKLNPVKIAKSIPKVDTYVKIWGYGGGRKTPKLKEGQVLPIGNWTGKYTITSIDGVNGDSGSGIFNRNDELVAVLWGEKASVRLDVVKEFLKEKLKEQNRFKYFLKELDDN